jgi:AmmeMemoRadiSam system protein B
MRYEKLLYKVNFTLRNVQLLDYRTSANVNQGTNTVVGYMSAMFYGYIKTSVY